MEKKGLWQRVNNERYLMLFVVSFVGMMLSFLPTMMKNGGIFLYYGDFNSQQQMFYFHANEMVRAGNLGWDWGTDLGSNFIGSYSFYLLGSPFFWLSTIFPIGMVRYLIPWLLALKTSVAAMTAYAYIRRFVKNKDAAFIGAMLYAYSGFQLYNVFFNHFHDVTAFFPLLLLTFEQLTQDDRRGVFALCVALCASISYFFFVCELVFLVLYFFIRCLDDDFRMDFKSFTLLLIEGALGVAISCIIFLPACYDVINNPRVNSRLYGTDMIFYGENVRIPRIIQAFFMMSDMPARVNILQSDNARWASIAGYLPMFSMVGVIAFMREKKKSWLTKIVAACALMMCVPWLNSIYVALNSSYYARWYFAPILMMCLMTALVVEEDADKLKLGYQPAVIVGGFFIAIGVLPKYIDGKVQFLQNFQYKEMYYMQALVTLVLMIIMGIIIYYLPRSKSFHRIVAGVTAAACVIVMFAGVNFGAVQDGGHEDYINYAINGREKLNMDKLDSMSDVNHVYDDNTFFRIDTSENVDNWCMFWGLSSMRTFHSVVPPSIMNFYESIGQTRDVASRMEPKLYALRSMFSVRYYFKRSNSDKNIKPAETVNQLTGFTYLDSQNVFDIYENQNWIPMGFADDHFVTDKTVKDAPELKRPNILLKAVELDTDMIKKYSDILSRYEYEASELTDETYAMDCAAKRAESCYYFKESTHGFDAKVNLDKEKVLFFSVPYEDGWTASINGKPVDIDKCSYGFMMIRCPAGDCDIHFEYKTAGLKEGIMLTVAGGAAWVIYMCVWYFDPKRKKAAAVAKKNTKPSAKKAAEKSGEDEEAPAEVTAEEAVNEDTENEDDDTEE